MAKDGFDLVIGLGVTGRSVIRYLTDQGMPVRAIDTRAEPAGLDALCAEFPDLKVHTGSFKKGWMGKARRLIVSPGVAVSTPAIAEQVVDGKEVIGDIELFARAASEPLVAITGSNAKSTVTTLLGQVADACGMNPGIGGNLGVAALELLDDQARLYVLELSSFQLETTAELNALAATVLNVSDDHMDRYSDKMAYFQAKQRIYRGCRNAIVNLDDALSTPMARDNLRFLCFG